MKKKVLLLSILFSCVFNLSALPFFGEASKYDSKILQPFFSLSEMTVISDKTVSLSADFKKYKEETSTNFTEEMTKEKYNIDAINSCYYIYYIYPNETPRQAKDRISDILKMNGYIH